MNNEISFYLLEVKESHIREYLPDAVIENENNGYIKITIPTVDTLILTKIFNCGVMYGVERMMQKR
jgi:hypothetical protein